MWRFFLLLLSIFERGLLKPSVEVVLPGFSMLPGVGLLVGAIHHLWQGDWLLFLVAGVTTLLALPLALWGIPACVVPPLFWKG